jgi:hypothetical protein
MSVLISIAEKLKIVQNNMEIYSGLYVSHAAFVPESGSCQRLLLSSHTNIVLSATPFYPLTSFHDILTPQFQSSFFRATLKTVDVHIKDIND